MKYLLMTLVVCFVACSQDNQAIKIKGSDTEVNLSVQLAEAFHIHQPTIFVSISGGGSGLGIASLLNGTTDIANSSRRINEKEIALFQEKGLVIDSFLFAQDAIAFVISADIPLDSIYTVDLAKILNGNFTNWNTLTHTNLPINIYGRQSNSGTYEFIKKKLDIEFSPYAKEMNGNAQILEAIKADNSGIGYVGAGYLLNGNAKGLKLLRIYDNPQSQSVSPLDAVQIAQGKYFFQRPLYQYYRSDNFNKIKAVFDFEQSLMGKKIIQSAGYYPLL